MTMATPQHDGIGKQLTVSAGEDAEALGKEAADLGTLGWKADSDGMGLEASFSFPTFAKAADFIATMNVQSKITNHHSETYNMHKMVYLHWTTHKPRGFSSKDVSMARWCHEQAIALGGQYMDDVRSWRNGCVGCDDSKM